jgi:hypothetical protein
VLLRSACWRSLPPSSSAAAKAAAPAAAPALAAVDQVKNKSAGAAVQSSGRIRPAARLRLAREESRKEWLTRRRDVAFYLLRDFHDLTLTPKTRQYLDEAVKENIARHEKEKKKQNRHEEAAGKVSRPGE